MTAERTTPESLVAGTRHGVPEGRSEAMSAGTCLVFDDRILHRGMGNRSDDTRHVAYFSYLRKGHSVDTYFESQRSVHDG